MDALKVNRKRMGWFVCLIAYMTAALMVWLIYDAVSIFHPILVVLVLDVLATLTIFLFSLGFNNSSLYDPYWSLIPPIIIVFWLFDQSDPVDFTLLQWIVLSLVMIWSLRLTWNWLARWNGIRDEDWRYIAFRFKYQEYYWIVSLFGIHLFPTIIILLGCLAVYPALVLGDGTMGTMEWIAAVVTFSGIFIEWIADLHLRRYICDKLFRRDTFLDRALPFLDGTSPGVLVDTPRSGHNDTYVLYHQHTYDRQTHDQAENRIQGLFQAHFHIGTLDP